MPTNEEIIFSIIILGYISMIIELGCFGLKLTPRFFYKKGMNWFGAYTVTILIGLISPTVFIIKILKYLFTVGRYK